MTDFPHYILNPDIKHVEKIRNAIQRNKELTGKEYCPCVLPKLRTDDTVCACKEYRTTGHCHCKLYLDESIDDNADII